MSSSPDDRAPVLRGSVAESAAAARFAVDLRRDVPVDSAPVERAKQEARTAGYAEGWAQGQRAAAAEAVVAAERARATAAAIVASMVDVPVSATASPGCSAGSGRRCTGRPS